MPTALEALRAARLAIDAAIASAEEQTNAAPAATMPPLPRFLSRKAARALLGLEVRAFDRAARELGPVKPGREWLLATDSLLEWIGRQRAPEPAVAESPDAPLSFELFAGKLRPKRLDGKGAR